MNTKHIFYISALVVTLLACSTKKNTFVSRAFHNLTARYNGYYYAGENIKEGIFKIEKSNKENFDKVIPVYIYPTYEKAKTNSAEFDLAIKKSSMCIQKHAIKDSKGNEISSAGKWIDNNWINIGISHFYKREFFDGIEAFEYVINSYPKSKDKFTAMIWLIKSFNEIGSVSSSEPIISFLKNEKNLPIAIKKELTIVTADYYLRRGQNAEAIAKLMEASRNSHFLFGISKKKRARYSFIVAQLLEKSKDNQRAIAYYKKTIGLKPNYEMVFYSIIKIAKLYDGKIKSVEKTKKSLLKMTTEFKNSDYFDVIYYTLGEIEEKENHLNQAILNYKKSVQTSVSNNNQKALSFLKLGEINFDLNNYQPAEAYYDSTIANLSKDNPEYEIILNRKKTLETLVGHIKTISREDSLQRLVKMNEVDRNAFIENLMLKLEKENELKINEAEKLQVSNNGSSNNQNADINSNFGGLPTFYFYNSNTKAMGISDFTKKWGNRPLEDNWRRYNKTIVVEELEINSKETKDEKKELTSNTKKKKEDYLKDLPFGDTLMNKSTSKIIRAYYLLGTIYKEELNDEKKTILTFEELNKRFPKNIYLLNNYYILYRTFLKAKNETNSNYYKNKILDDFPQSEFALLIKNPEYAIEINTKKSELESFYNGTYNLFKSDNFIQSYAMSKEGISKFGKNDYLPKFEFIKAISYGKLKGIDSLEYGLKLLVAKYPNSDVIPLSKDILLSIKNQKNPESILPVKKTIASLDSFLINFEVEHFLVVLYPDEAKISEEIKINLGRFNSNYYPDNKLTLSDNLFANNKQITLIKSFVGAKESMAYFKNLMKNTQLFSGEIKKELVDIYPVSSSNLPLIYKNKSFETYRLFFNENYKIFE